MTKSKPTIYIIDDNASICNALQWMLEAAIDYTVATYNSAESFLHQFDLELHGILIIDILMPDMNGFELLRELEKRGNQMPILVLTGHGDMSMATQAIRAGARDFITKPFNSQILLQKINSILDEYYTRNE